MKDKIAVHCPTNEIYHKVRSKLNNGLMEGNWSCYKEDTFVEISKNPSFCYRDWWVKSGYRIIPASEYL